MIKKGEPTVRATRAFLHLPKPLPNGTLAKKAKANPTLGIHF